VGQALVEDDPQGRAALEPTSLDIPDEVATRAAYHFERSLVPHRAAPYLVQAAEAAMDVYAHESAIDYYRRALDLLSCEEERASVMVDLAHAQHVIGRWADVEDLYRQAIDLAAEAGAHRVEARAWCLVAEAQESRGDYAAALESADHAVDAARRSGREGRGELAAALHRTGWARFRLGDGEGAQRLGEEALELAEAIGAWKRQADSLNLLSAIHNQSGAYDQARDCMEQALQLFREAGYRRGEAVMLGNLGNTAYLRGDYEGAIERYRQGLALARQIGHRYTEMLCLNNLGGAQVAVGTYEEAAASLGQVLEMPESEAWFLLPDTYRYLAEARLALGELEPTRQAAQRVLDLVWERGERAPEYEGTAWRILGEVAARRGESVEVADERYDAETCFTESLRIFEAANMEMERARTERARDEHQKPPCPSS
jgi:tetratricopeptide (TPR) repeat protein